MGFTKLTDNPVVTTVVVVAVLLILAGLGFMASQSAAIVSAAGITTSVIGLIALLWGLGQVGKK